MQTIERLVAFGPRWPGADGDEPTVDHLAGELRAAGRQVDIERIRVRPSYHIALALLFALPGVQTVYYGDEFGVRGVKEDRAGGDDAVRPELPDSTDAPGAEAAAIAMLDAAGVPEAHIYFDKFTTTAQ